MSILIQICFAGNANLENVRNQLKELKAKHEGDRFVSCFLTREMVIEKGFSLDIVDMIDEELGDIHLFDLCQFKTFDEAMAGINDRRTKIANMVDKMYVLDSGTAEGVRKEIDLYIGQKLVLMP